MVVSTVLRRTLEQGGMDDMAMCLCSLNKTGAVDRRPLFFYHLEKTGGIATHVALKAVQVLHNSAEKDQKAYFRFHAEDATLEQTKSVIRQSPMLGATYVGKIGLQTYGVHEALGHPWRLMTILRDPFDRLVSWYHHDIRRGRHPGPACADNFMAYVSQPWRCHYQCKMLSRLGANAECDVKNAFEETCANLETFDWVGLLSDIEEILLNVWSAYGFHPFISERIHKNPYEKESFESLRDDVYDMNRYELELVQRVSEHPKRFFKIEPDQDTEVTLPELFSIVTDSTHDDKGNWAIKFGHTRGLIQYAQQRGGTLRNLYDSLVDPADSR